MVTASTHQTTRDLLDAVMEIATVSEYNPTADETFVGCTVCGDWEGHRDECPAPAIRRWLDLLDAEDRRHDQQYVFDNAGRFQL